MSAPTTILVLTDNMVDFYYCRESSDGNSLHTDMSLQLVFVPLVVLSLDAKSTRNNKIGALMFICKNNVQK